MSQKGSHLERLRRLSFARVIRADRPALHDATAEFGLTEGKVEDLAAN